jgi:hypothetical protein
VTTFLTKFSASPRFTTECLTRKESYNCNSYIYRLLVLYECCEKIFRNFQMFFVTVYGWGGTTWSSTSTPYDQRGYIPMPLCCDASLSSCACLQFNPHLCESYLVEFGKKALLRQSPSTRYWYSRTDNYCTTSTGSGLLLPVGG